MARRKRVQKSPEPDFDEIDFRKGAAMKQINTWEDIGGNSEDEFHDARDKIDFEQYSDDDVSEQEVLGLEGIESDEDYDEELEDQEIERLEAIAKQLKPVKYNSDESEQSEEEQEQGWGKSKNLYYNAEDDASDDDEVALEEEKEVLRLQKKRAAQMDDQDYFDEVESAKEDDFVMEEQKSYTIKEKVEILASNKPEILEFADEFQEKWSELQNFIIPAINLMKESSDRSFEKAGELVYFKYRVLCSYLTNISMFLALHADNSEFKINIKNHPVVDNLLKSSDMLEIRDSQELYDTIQQIANEPIESEQESLSESFDEPETLVASQEEEEEEMDDFEIMPLPTVNRVKRKRMQDFGESKELDEIDLMEKMEKLESIKFSATRKYNGISSKRKLLKATPKPETVQEELELSDEAFSEEKLSDIEFYESIKQSKESSKASRQQAAKEDEEWSKQAAKEAFYSKDVKNSEKRAATWKILKNKGLTPRRAKENRNPRVKRRVKYETAVKRLKDFKSVAVDKSSIGAYSGEKSGIKSNLARSVRL